MTPEATAAAVPHDTLAIGVLADFNVQNLAVLLQKSATDRHIKCAAAPFGQTVNLLLDPTAEFWSAHHDAVVLWTAPDRAVPAFSRVLAFEEYRPEDLLQGVDDFVALLDGIPETVRTIVVPSWVVSGAERGWGPRDLTAGVGVANALMRINLRLADRLESNRRVILLDAQRWIGAAGEGAYNPTLWYLSKTPFHSTVFREASRDIVAALDGVRGRAKKIVIVDLDNTLWGGVVGDLGWERLKLGGHDPIGEAFVDFQKALKRLMNRGVVLAVVSKNEENVALDAIRRHPEMILRTSDFAAWRINWDDKALNIVDLLAELNLGIDSAVFLDDSPFERARVREALPAVLVPDLPADPTYYPSFLSQLRCFDSPSVTSEDRKRTQMYVADRDRTALKQGMTSLEQWLELLELHVSVERLNAGNLERAAQLFNKTNQLTLSTRRLPASDLLHWSQSDRHAMWTFRVWDRFGDYGLCGVTSLARDDGSAQIVDFLLSCRVMGRGVEDVMLATVLRHARALGCDSVSAEYVPSPKNHPCAKWLHTVAGAAATGNRFTFGSERSVAFPPHIDVSFS